VLAGGCAETSFVGRQYDNFTAYYNKFYNARNAFEEGVQAMQDRDRPIDRTEYLSVFWEPEGTSTESSFKEAIQKSADVLREHPNSKWVDDALLLIGKSYFYQQNYAGAAQKFREVLALDGELGLEPGARKAVVQMTAAMEAEILGATNVK
jgi:tetratricopeptide (TPR) repeat protein